MLIKVLAVMLASVWATEPITASVIVGAQTRQNRQQKADRYACPMDPEVTSNRRGKCPKCGMALRLVARETDADAARDGNTEEGTGGSPPVSSFSPTRIPDVRVYDQNGAPLRFYSDLVKGKTVAINFIFTTCTTICPPLTATFAEVQRDLKKRAIDAPLISISVDPTTDTSERLREFAGKFKAGPGWTFVTGNKTDIDSVLRALGAAVSDKNDHTPMILIGNDGIGYWTRAYGLSSAAALVKAITEAAGRK